jgi:hypothetical protein
MQISLQYASHLVSINIPASQPFDALLLPPLVLKGKTMSEDVIFDMEMWMRAARVAGKRMFEAVRMGLTDKHGMRKIDGLSSHINGACGELAVATLLGMEWDESVNVFKVPDVGNLHVRTRSEDWHDLIIRDNDADGLYVLVTGIAPKLTVQGVCDSRRVKVPKYRKTYGGREEAWFIPQKELSSVYELKKRIGTD